MATMRIKVKVSALIEGAEKAKAKAIADHKKAQAKYDRALVKWGLTVHDALYEARVAAGNGKSFETTSRYGSGTCLLVPVRGSSPAKPRLNTAQVDRDIAFLKAAADETLSISTDSNLGRYL